MADFYNGQKVLVLGQDVSAVFENKIKGFGRDGARISTTVPGSLLKFYSFVPAEWVTSLDSTS